MTKRFHNILKLNFIYERKKKIVMDDMYISVHSQSQQFMRRIYDLSIAISFQSNFRAMCHIHIEFRCDPFGSRLHFNGCAGCWMPNNSVDFFSVFFLFNKKQSPLAPITTTMKMHSFPTYSFRLCCLNELRNERYRYSVVSKMISLCCWYLLSQRHKIQSLSSHSLYFHLFCFTFSKSIRSDAKKMQIIIRCEWNERCTRHGHGYDYDHGQKHISWFFIAWNRFFCDSFAIVCLLHLN